jgi:hypothetical protein
LLKWPVDKLIHWQDNPLTKAPMDETTNRWNSE